VADAKGSPIGKFMSAGQTSDYFFAQVLLSSFPLAGAMLADRGYDADWFRNNLIEMGVSLRPTPNPVPIRLRPRCNRHFLAGCLDRRKRLKNLPFFCRSDRLWIFLLGAPPLPKQPAFPGLREAMKKKQTRRELFLAEMDAVVPGRGCWR